MAWTLLLFSLAIVAASAVGGLLPLATVLTHTRLQLYLSFAAGVMLGAAFFHMLPETVQLGARPALAWTATGLLALFFLERFFSFHHHEPAVEPLALAAHGHAHDQGLHSCELVHSAPSPPNGAGADAPTSTLQWKIAAFGLTVHSLVGGVALASAAASRAPSGHASAAWGVFLATVVHKPADALTIVSLMLRGGVDRSRAHLVNLLFALMIPLGIGLFFLGLRLVDPAETVPITSAALAFSAGTFLCIALSDLLPELQFHAHDRVKLSLALLAGVGLMASVSIWE